MNDNEIGRTIPFFVHEAEMDRHTKVHKRDFVEKILLIVLLVATNIAWLWYESQFEYIDTTTTVTQENESGYNAYIGNDGDVVYGTTDGDNKDER